MTGGLGLVGEGRRAPAVVVAGADPDVDGLGPRVGRDHRVGRAQERLAQQLRDLRLADAVEPQRPDLEVRADAARREPRQHVVGPHRPHLARRAGKRDDDPAVGPLDPPARAPSRWGSAARSPTGSATPACG